MSEPTQTQQPRPRRQDAQRNRDRILWAATAAFTSSGLDTSLEAIARAAGVGIGTLYRHFPTREALAVAAYQHEVGQLCERAAELGAALPPGQALREWTSHLVKYVATKRGMAPVLRSVLDPSDPYFADVRAQIHGAIEGLLTRAAQSGYIRRDVSTSDVIQAMSGIWLATPRPEQQDLAGRLLNLLMDGLRYGAPRPQDSGA